jgi:hypothetical protein
MTTISTHPSTIVLSTAWMPLKSGSIPDSPLVYLSTKGTTMPKRSRNATENTKPIEVVYVMGEEDGRYRVGETGDMHTRFKDHVSRGRRPLAGLVVPGGRQARREVEAAVSKAIAERGGHLSQKHWRLNKKFYDEDGNPINRD